MDKELRNLVYSCLIDGGTEHKPITLEEATYTLQCWRDGGDIEVDGISPEAFRTAWNKVLKELTKEV